MSERPVALMPLWPVEASDTDPADSSTLTRVADAPSELAAAGSWITTATSLLPADVSIDDAYRRFIAVVDACDAVHVEVDAVFAALRDLHVADTEPRMIAVLARLSGAWRRLDGEILHLAEISPRSLDAVSSITADLYQVLRQILAHGVRFQGGNPTQFMGELDALADRLAQHDRYTRTQEGGHR